MTHHFRIRMHGLSDIGRKRERNEDAIAWDADTGLAVLADGMGGHQAGEVASQLALQVIQRKLGKVLQGQVDDLTEYGRILLTAVHQANREIHCQSVRYGEYAGMGTTLVLLLFAESWVICAHVGDSRAYRLRDAVLQRLTSDHSLVQQMVDTGQYDEEQARRSVSRNIITRALGITEEVAVDSDVHEVHKGDVYLLCSDGLTDLVSEREIRDTLMQHSDDLAEAARLLVASANGRGGKDNISVILAAVHG